MGALTAVCATLFVASAAHNSDGPLTPANLRAALGRVPGGPAASLGEEKVSLKLASGEVRGRVTSLGVQRYLGVPFAQPPVGPLRWEAPQPVADWEGVREAAEYSKSCAQEPNVFDDFSGVSEDCLYLNLWTPDRPAPPAGEKYAAMIFFYGGSWTSGSAMFPLYTGEALTLGNNATVVVTVNYRLAALGFLGSDFLRASDGSAGNWGLQDQRMAMQWVKANAEHLNVDTSKIMIFGESAGAGSVSSHLVAHRSRGLFTRAAMESGPFADWTSITLEEGRPRFEKFASHLNCTLPASGVAANATPAEIAEVQECLRSKNLTQVLAGMKHLPSPEGLVGWSPTVDNVEFTADVQVLAAKGDIANVPVMLGTNKNEGSTFVHLSHDANASDLDRYVVSQIDKDAAVLAEIEAAYPPSSFEKTLFGSAAWWAASEMLGDAEMTCAARRTAAYLSTLRGPDAAAAFVYWFTYELTAIPLLELVTKTPFGVFHGSELSLVFCAEELLLEERERKLSKKVREYWTNFAFSGDPNVGRSNTDLPHWPAHVQATNLTLNLNMDLGTISNLKAERCDLWDRVGPVHPPR